jgi:hypothetical protein
MITTIENNMITITTPSNYTYVIQVSVDCLNITGNLNNCKDNFIAAVPVTPDTLKVKML